MKNKKTFLIVTLISILSVSILSGCVENDNKKEEKVNISLIKIADQTDMTIKHQMLVNGKPFIIKGVGYNPVPIRDNPNTKKKDYFTTEYAYIYNRDLPILRAMGANTIRLWGWDNSDDHTDFLKKAYNNGKDPIYVIVSFWIDPDTNVSSPEVRKDLKRDFRDMVSRNKDNNAILMWSIGNELNARLKHKLDDLFSLIDEMAKEAHLEEGNNSRPVTTTLIDWNTTDTIKAYDSNMTNLDAWGVQLYRGKTFGNFLKVYPNVSSKPVIIMEFGIDAYDNVDQAENQGMQAKYVRSLWGEIEENSNITIGGLLTTYSDGWWKSGTRMDCPDKSPSIQGDCGSPMKNFPDGFANDEWWGIVRIKENGNSPDIVEPRDVYYTMKELWTNKKN